MFKWWEAVVVWYLDLQLPTCMQSVPITTDVVSSNLDQGVVSDRLVVFSGFSGFIYQ